MIVFWKALLASAWEDADTYSQEIGDSYGKDRERIKGVEGEGRPIGIAIFFN